MNNPKLKLDFLPDGLGLTIQNESEIAIEMSVEDGPYVKVEAGALLIIKTRGMKAESEKGPFSVAKNP